MRALLAIAGKDLRVLSRDRMALFWALVFPAVFALFFGSIMKVGDDAKPERVAVVLVASASDGGRVRETARALRAAGLQVSTAAAGDAREAVRQGRAAMFVELPAPGELAPVRVGIDPGRRAEADLATGVLQLVLLRALAPSIAVPPIARFPVTQAQRGPRTGYQVVFPAMILWSLIGCAAAFAVALVSERGSGTLLRLYAAPLSRGAIAAGKALACALACLLGTLVLTVVGVALLGVAIADPLKYAAALVSTATCFVGITQLLGALGCSEQAVAGAGWSVLIVLAMTGGAMVPAMLMPDWLRAVSGWSPVQWGIAALEGATFRALDWAELALPVALLWAAGLACGALSALILRLREA